MFKKINSGYKNKLHLLVAVLFSFSLILSVSQTVFAQSKRTENPYLVGTFWAGGKLIDRVIFPGRPPKYFRMPAAKVPEPSIAMGNNILANVPAFDWSYGCSATSAAMMAGYYDNNGFPNMYAGPGGTPAGVCPMDNSEWGSSIWPSGEYSECPLSATHLGKDGLGVKGHVDDYWIDYDDAGPDPYIVGPWAEHVKANCTGDFMKTNQSAYGLTDGATGFFIYPDGSQTTYADLVNEGVYGPMGTYADYDGGCGLADFFTSRGYTWTTMYNQYIEEVVSGGFTYEQFQAEIDAGRPVLIQLWGHTMLGYGYSTTGNLIYVHDTWDYSNHTMTWGGYYTGGLLHQGVTVIHLEPSFEGTVLLDADSYSAPDTVNVTVWDGDLDLDVNNPDNTTVDFESDLTTDIETVTLTETGNSTGIFTGSIDTQIGTAAVNGILDVEDSDTITVTYEDLDHDGGGTPATLTDEARISLISTPTGLTGTAGRTYVFLGWNPVDSPVLDGYNVYRSSSLSGTKTKLNSSLVANNSYRDLYLASGTTYYYWVVAVDTYGIETDYSPEVRVTTVSDDGDDGDGDDGDDGDGDNGDGVGSGGDDGVGTLPGCFVATACYGTPMAREVKTLSCFRDEYLLGNSLGRMFVQTYYKVSPPIASFISKHPHLKNLVRCLLKPVADFSKALVKE